MTNLSLRNGFQSGGHISRNHPDPVRGETNELTDDNFLVQNSKVHHINDTDTGKRKRTLTEKGKQQRISILDKQKKTLVSIITRKVSNVGVFLYFHGNYITVKEELKQLNDVFQIIQEIKQEMIEFDDNDTKTLIDLWLQHLFQYNLIHFESGALIFC